MKLTSASVAALVLAPAAIAGPVLEDRKAECRTVPWPRSLSTNIATTLPAATRTIGTTKTINSAPIVTVDQRTTKSKSLIHYRSINPSGTDTIFVLKVAKVTVNADIRYTKTLIKTVTSDRISRVAAPTNFTPAAGTPTSASPSALAKRDVQARDANDVEEIEEREALGISGSAGVSVGASVVGNPTHFKTVCVTSTIKKGTTTVHSSARLFLSLPTTTTLTGQIAVGGGYIYLTATETITATTTTTSTFTHFSTTLGGLFTRTVAVHGPIATVYAACLDPANYLNTTVSLSASVGADLESNVKQSPVNGLLARGAVSGGLISNVTVGTGFSTRSAGKIGSVACCNKCFGLLNCAGSYTDQSGACSLVLSSTNGTCSTQVALGAYTDKDIDDAVNVEFTISNGACGFWQDGDNLSNSSSAASTPTAIATNSSAVAASSIGGAISATSTGGAITASSTGGAITASSTGAVITANSTGSVTTSATAENSSPTAADF